MGLNLNIREQTVKGRSKMSGSFTLTPGEIKLKMGKEVTMSCKILIVEDDKNLNLMLKLILKNKKDDWEVQGAHNGEEALKVMENFRPRVVLLDLMMPEMDGFEFLRHAAKSPLWPTLKIAILTSHSDESVRTKAETLGVKEFWTKPIMPEVLVNKLHALIAKD